jgi:hypothetical protein
MHKDSMYKKRTESLESRIDLGFDYKSSGMLNKFLSPTMFGNPRLKEFLNRIDSIFINITDSVKTIQFFFNYTVDKNDKRYNY